MRLPRARLARAPALLANSLLIGLAACVSPPAMGPPWDPTEKGLYVDWLSAPDADDSRAAAPPRA